MDANVLKKISMWNNANLETSLRNELNNLTEEETNLTRSFSKTSFFFLDTALLKISASPKV